MRARREETNDERANKLWGKKKKIYPYNRYTLFASDLTRINTRNNAKKNNAKKTYKRKKP